MAKGVIADTSLLFLGCLGLLMQCWMGLAFSINLLTRAAPGAAGFPALLSCCNHFMNKPQDAAM